MSLSNGPAETPSQSSRAATGGDSSSFAPTWLRRGRSLSRNVVRMHFRQTPSVAPGEAPEEVAASRIPHPSGPELLAEDAVLKRLLQRSPDPAVRPVPDPVGLALGMVARLMVAGCAAAAVALLLLGVIPPPFKLSAPIVGDARLASTPLGPGPAGAIDDRMSAVAPKDSARALADTSTDPAPQPARVATVSVRAPSAAIISPSGLDPGEVERLVKRGESYLAQGDIAAARLVLRRAAEARDPRAALSLAATFDPAVLRQLHVVGFPPDPAQARAWYEMAAGYGSAEAVRRLAVLSSARAQ
jgi:hypothetical protein